MHSLVYLWSFEGLYFSVAECQPYTLLVSIAMDDLQLVTRFSIMISEFVQLHCGLATYYSLVILELAWFSSLTHRSYLTLLRTYLVNHIPDRTWRLSAVALLAAILVIGFLYTRRPFLGFK